MNCQWCGHVLNAGDATCLCPCHRPANFSVTSSPLSETGPSPEAVAREFCEEWRLANDVEPALARLIAHIQRSAHLEDARAGCRSCHNGDVPNRSKVGTWYHGTVTQGDIDYCRRPEVWDALFLLPPKGTK